MTVSSDKNLSVASEYRHYGSVTVVSSQGLTANLTSDLSLAELPHPWHIQVPDADSDDPEIYQRLVDLHTCGDIHIGDVISGIKRPCLTNVSYVAKIFAGDYSANENELANGQIQQTLTRVVNVANANIHRELPRSAEEITTELKKYGHILVRSETPVNEQHILQLLGNGEAMDYRYGNTAREQLKDSQSLKVTAWPKALMLPAHN
ncbi:MAG: hypothetical protein AAFY17_16875, partial [Cyanobacteria bacterium J06642_11]